MSWLTLKSPDCASCTVIHSCVLCCHRAQLQGELLLGYVSGDRDVMWFFMFSNIIAFFLMRKKVAGGLCNFSPRYEQWIK
jgi:hypothetical protein